MILKSSLVLEVLVLDAGACGGVSRHPNFGKALAPLSVTGFENASELTPPGVLAYRDQAAVGWCAVAPREKYRRLAFSRTLPPIDDNPVWAITCLYVAKGDRQQGLRRRLIEAGCELAANFGASVVEAYPRISPDKP